MCADTLVAPLVLQNKVILTELDTLGTDTVNWLANNTNLSLEEAATFALACVENASARRRHKIQNP